MSEIRQLEDRNVGSEQNSNLSDDESPTAMFSAFMKLLIRAMPEIRPLADHNVGLEQNSSLSEDESRTAIFSAFMRLLIGELSGIRQLADRNVRSEQNSGLSVDESRTAIFPAFMKAELEVMVIPMMQLVLESTIEPLIRKVVKEEIELVQERILTIMNQNSGNNIHHSEPRSCLQLRFLNKLALPVVTGRPIKGEDLTSVKVALVDVSTGEIVKVGPEASAKVEIALLQLDGHDDGKEDDWTSGEFNQKIVLEGVANKLLTGNVFLKLEAGVGSVEEISVAHGKDWIKKRQLRLGARLVENLNGTRVKEAKSEPFILEDRRNTMYKKHHPPSQSSEVWRLKNIAKSGSLCKQLSEENIKTVEDFLTWYFRNREGLRDILGKGMSDQKLVETVNHGLECKFDEYLYHPPSARDGAGIVFTTVGQLLGVLYEGRYVPFDKLPGVEKADAQKWVLSAFEHWGQVVPYSENHSSHIASAFPPSNSLALESPSGPNFGTTQMIIGNDHAQPSTSSLGTIPSDQDFIGTSQMVSGHDRLQPSTSSPELVPLNNTFKRTSSVDGSSSFTICEMEFRCEPSAAAGQVPDDQIFHDWMKQMLQDYEDELCFRDNNCNGKCKKWWHIMSLALKFNILLRKGIEESNHDRKKQRLH